MSYRMHITTHDGKCFDVSSLVHGITYTTSLESQPGTLNFIMEKDPDPKRKFEFGKKKDRLEFGMGSRVQFWDGDFAVFRGNIFTLEDNGKNYRVTAYDQLRYFKNRASMTNMKGDGNGEKATLTEFFYIVCEKLNIKDRKADLETKTPLEAHYFADETYFDMIQYEIKDNMKYDHVKGKDGHTVESTLLLDDGTFLPWMFYLKDVDGVVTLKTVALPNPQIYIDDTGVKRYKGSTPEFIIGEKSLLTDYQYSVSIDEDTYNEVVLVQNVGDGKHSIKLAKQDKDNIKKWGVLRKTIIINDNVNDNAESKEKMKQYADLLLNVKGRPTRTMRLNALGVTGLDAGGSFWLELESFGEVRHMYAKSVTHNFGSVHTMSIEVAGAETLPDSMARTGDK